MKGVLALGLLASLPLVGIGHLTFMAGYMILDADVHEKDGAVIPAGVAPRISGPVFSVQFRY